MHRPSREDGTLLSTKAGPKDFTELARGLLNEIKSRAEHQPYAESESPQVAAGRHGPKAGAKALTVAERPAIVQAAAAKRRQQQPSASLTPRIAPRSRA